MTYDKIIASTAGGWFASEQEAKDWQEKGRHELATKLGIHPDEIELSPITRLDDEEPV